MLCQSSYHMQIVQQLLKPAPVLAFT